MSSLALSPVFMVAPTTTETSQLAKPAKKSRKLPPRPVAPECMNNHAKCTDADWEVIRAHLAELKAWEEKAAEKGRGYSPDTVRSQAIDGHELLMEWLKMTGAPEEILTIAGWLPSVEKVSCRYYMNWRHLDKHAASRVAQFVPAMRQAIKNVRFYLRAKKAE